MALNFNEEFLLANFFSNTNYYELIKICDMDVAEKRRMKNLWIDWFVCGFIPYICRRIENQYLIIYKNH